MDNKRPKFITFIGCFYILGSVLLLLSLGTEQIPGINVRFGMPHASETIVRVSVASLSLIMAYGYLKLKAWGYWLAVTCSALFLCISLNLVILYNNQPFMGNAIWSFIVLIYTLSKRKCFTDGK